MKRFKKLSVAIVVLAMCALLGISVWAANTSDVTYTATFDKPTLCKTGADQTVTLTVKTNTAVEMDSLTASVTSDLEISSVTFGALTGAEWNSKTGMIMWYSADSENVTTDTLAVVTVKVPANVSAGNYNVKFDIVDISANGGNVWETGETVSATLTVAEHKWNAPTYSDKEGDTHTANYVCGNDASHTKSETAKHDFTNGDCVCGASALTVTTKGEITYTVSGRVVTVTHSAACKVGYWDVANEKYVAIPAIDNNDGSYIFNVPNGYNEVLIVVKGDVTGDARFNLSDTRKISKSTLKESHKDYEPLTETWQIFAADVTNDGRFNLSDRRMLAASRLKTTHENYKALTW